MNGRLAKDAADSLTAWEAFRERQRARWAAAQPPKIVGTWAPKIDEQERAVREQQIQDGLIPF